jgi:hypothetical protein
LETLEYTFGRIVGIETQKMETFTTRRKRKIYHRHREIMKGM